MIHIDGQALIDFNRSGTPLVEIVTQPDFRTAEEVSFHQRADKKEQTTTRWSDADMEMTNESRRKYFYPQIRRWSTTGLE